MSTLGNLPSAILVETRDDVVIRQESILSSVGYQVDVVGSVAQLQRRVVRGGDIRMILSKTELADASPIEMIDLVRRIPQGRDIPIVFYGWQPPGLHADDGRRRRS